MKEKLYSLLCYEKILKTGVQQIKQCIPKSKANGNDFEHRPYFSENNIFLSQ